MMPKCPHCNQPFSYHKLLPFAWKARVGVECSNCHNTSYNSASMRKKGSIIVLIVPLLLIIKELFNIPFPIMYAIFFAILVGFIFSLPLFVKPRKEEEPLW